VLEQALNLGEWLNAFRRYASVILVFVAVGLCGGIVYTLAKPAMFTSKALVLLPLSPLNANGQSTRGIATQVQIAMSPGILNSAGAHVNPHLGYSVLQHRIAVSGLTSDLMQITAQGTTGRQAEQLANSVAATFVAYTTKAAASPPSVTAALRQESSQIQRQMSDLQQEISNTTASAASDGAGSAQAQGQLSLLANLEAQKQNASLQLDSVDSQIAQTELSEPAGGTGTVILDRATTILAPSPLRSVTFGFLGVLAGVLIGTLVALRAIRRDRRLRRRDDIAQVVGVPVVDSVTLRSRSESSDWIDLFVRWQPGVEDAWSTRKMLRRWADGPMVTDVTVIALAGDGPALALAPRLAASAAAIEIPVTFVDDTDHECASNLRRATTTLASESAPTRASLRVCSVNEAPKAPAIGLVVTAVVLDPHDPLWHATNQSNTTWLALSSGFATAEELARVSIAAADAGQRIEGIVVVNPDPGDSTTGRFPAQISDTGSRTPQRTIGTMKGAMR